MILALGSNKDDKVQEFIKAGLDQRVAMELYDRVIMTTNINQNFTKDVVNRLVFSLKQLPANEAVNAIKSSTRIQNNNLVGDYLFHLSTLMITKNTFFSLGQLLTEGILLYINVYKNYFSIIIIQRGHCDYYYHIIRITILMLKI